MRSNKKNNSDERKKPQRAFRGAIPFGYTPLDGRLVIDPKEIKIVRKIITLSQKNMSFNAISKCLNDQKIKSKLGKSWSDKTVASVIRRHQINIDEESHHG